MSETFGIGGAVEDRKQRAFEEAVKELLYRAGFLEVDPSHRDDYDYAIEWYIKNSFTGGRFSTIEALDRANLHRLASVYKKIKEHE